MNARHHFNRKPLYFELTAGELCLDFINTLDDRPSAPKELINSYLDLLHFAEDANILDPAQIKALSKTCASGPAQRALKRALELREALFAIFSANIRQMPAPSHALDTLNQHLQAVADHLRLVERKRLFSWNFVDVHFPEAILWPIARSAANLLASHRLQFVRACSAKRCGWFFLDTSKNHRRLWCDMKRCGNRAKVRRFYERQKREKERAM
jgi:predicted RNA-binding Zn ribbon-like protein